MKKIFLVLFALDIGILMGDIILGLMAIVAYILMGMK